MTLRPRHQSVAISDEDYLYNHWIKCANTEKPSQLIDRFDTLLIDGNGYPDAAVWEALTRIVMTPTATENFRFVLNRTCHILVNRWLQNPQLQGYVPELVDLMASPCDLPMRSRVTLRLRSLVNQFLTTEEYATLKRLAQVVRKPVVERKQVEEKRQLGDFLHRYPALYDYCLLTDTSTDDEKQRIQQMRIESQRHYEDELTQYLAYRRWQDAPSQSRWTTPVPANPTLLKARQIDQAVTHFVGLDGETKDYRTAAHDFITHSAKVQSYQAYKEEFYQYLTDSIPAQYGSRHFNDRLYRYLQGTLATNNKQRPNPMMVLSTVRKLLNFLVIDSPEHPNHAVFLDLLGNLGVTRTVGLLLKLVLVCRKAKTYLEKRLAILFQHYQASTEDRWLIDVMEHVAIAFGIHFGNVHVPQ